MSLMPPKIFQLRPKGSFLLVISVFFCVPVSAASFVYRRPLPQPITNLNPATVIDIFSYSVVFQIHASLFRFDSNYNPMPHLIERFAIGPDQKSYDFYLKNLLFHNGTPVIARHVKTSLENAVKYQATNHDALDNIVGCAQQRKTGKGISGLVLDKSNPRHLTVKLSKPDPEFLHKLTDISFAIWNSDAGFQVGLGAYKLIQSNSTQTTLERFAQPDEELGPGPKRVELPTLPIAKAVDEFILGKVDDLFLYTLPQEARIKLESIAHQQRVIFPRTYYFALNARRHPSLTQRKNVLSNLDKGDLVARCYPSETPAHGLIPPGYIGHSGNQKEESAPAKPAVESSQSLSIIVAEGIGSESCVAAWLSKALGRNANVKTASVDEMVTSWRRNTIDGFLAYMEGETTLHYFGPFSPESNFPIGVSRNQSLLAALRKFMLEEEPSKKQPLGEALEQEVLSMYTVLPLFHPKSYLVYSKRLKKIKTPFMSASLTPLTEFELSNFGGGAD